MAGPDPCRSRPRTHARRLAGRFSTQRLKRLYRALDVQISVFGGLFLYGLVTCLVIVFGKTIGWHLPTIVLNLGWKISLDLSYGFVGLISGLLVFLSLRSIAIISGVRSILKLVSDMALDEAAEREDAQFKTDHEHIKSYNLPSHYGDAISLPEMTADTVHQ